MPTAKQPPVGIQSRAGERRKNPRFDMHFAVFLRAMGGPWSRSQTADVSAAGAFFTTDSPFLLNTPVEYVLTFPQELTKAKQPLRVRFFGSVLRCERIPDANGAFGVAVRKTGHRYLSKEEAANFDSIEQEYIASSSGLTAIPDPDPESET